MEGPSRVRGRLSRDVQVAPAAARLAPRVTRELLEELLGRVPASWLEQDAQGAYVEYLAARVAAADRLAAEIEAARA